MFRKLTLFTALCLTMIYSGLSVAAESKASAILSVMAEGVGDLSYASPEWVDAARLALSEIVAGHADQLEGVDFTYCEVAHNPPVYLHQGPVFAWYMKIKGGTVEVGVGELKKKECDLKIEADHSILSNLAHIQYNGNDPEVVAEAQARLSRQTRWEVSGSGSDNPVLKAVTRKFHDRMAPRTLPRFVWMSPEWVSIARYICTTRAEEFAEGIQDVDFLFNEVFTDPPAYAFPDGKASGFWVHCSYGTITVGAGYAPEALGKVGYMNQLLYAPVLPVGRTVNAAMTDDDKKSQAAYSGPAFAVKVDPPVNQSTPDQKGQMPAGMGRVMMVLHDELSKRSSGELTSDFDDSVRPEWGTPFTFDRHPDADASWLQFDKFDTNGDPIE